MPSRVSWRKPAVLVAVAALVLGACGTAASESPAPATSAGVDAFSALVRASGLQLDYDQLDSPDEAAAIADLVAEGTVVSVVEGRALVVEKDDPSVDSLSLVLGVRIDDVVQGDLAKGSDGIAYIEIPRDGQTSVAEYQQALPKGAEAALYLTLLPQEDGLHRDDLAGRPAGQRIWVAISPQGLVLADGAQSQELLSGTRFDAPLSAFLPPSPAFPTAVSGSGA